MLGYFDIDHLQTVSNHSKQPVFCLSISWLGRYSRFKDQGIGEAHATTQTNNVVLTEQYWAHKSWGLVEAGFCQQQTAFKNVDLYGR